jgi:hypothetical protein
VFFVIGIVAFAAMAFLMWKLRQAVAELKPKVDRLTETVTEASKHLRDTAADVQHTAHVVRGKSDRVLGTGGIVDVVTDRLGLLSTVVGVVMALAKARNELGKMRSSGKERAAPKK